jgi:putative peptidoglycan lipid II flippase
MRICDFPQGIFVMALSTAALPSLSTLAARGATREVAATWAHGMSLALFVALPASAVLVVLGEPVVVALFQRGAFDARAAHETARALVWQGGAVWTVAAVRQTIPALYALGDTRSPVVVSALDLTAFIALAVSLRSPMGHAGISAAVAGSSAVQMVLLLVALKWRMGTICADVLARSAARTLVASLVAAGAGWMAVHWTSAAAASGSLGRLVPGICGLAVFSVTFTLTCRMLGSPELSEISGAMRRTLTRRMNRT